MDAERERLSQAKLLAWLKGEKQITEMVTVYLSESNDRHDRGIYCVLIPTAKIEQCLSSPSWDLMHGWGLPGAVQYFENGKTVTSYLRFGNDDGYEPLVIDRKFHGIRPDYTELSEEFRLFHSLYHDQQQGHYIKIDDDGNEHLIAIIEPNRVQVRLKEIRQFLAIKEMHLGIQFDCREHSMHTLEEIGLAKGGRDSREGLLCWGLRYGDLEGIGSHRAFSRLLGKRLIPPLPKAKSGFWGFAAEKPKEYVNFVIGADENGDEITHTSNAAYLADNFGANPGAPHYLTAVHFRKQVLDKYYQQPGKYSVGDAILRCGYLWSMCLDNHHDDKVCAWLGDLGRDLPHAEQLHWRSYNILPTGSVSETFFRRQILARPTNSDRPEHVFQLRYEALTIACEECLGWRLLLPLTSEDRHHFQCVRVPATDEQKDFDDLVLGLTKILIDSLNEKALRSLIPVGSSEGLKGGIALLEAALIAKSVARYEEHIQFLRRLQALRSSGAAHRKGSNYRKIAAEFGVNSLSLRSVFHGILGRALHAIDYLTGVASSGQLKEG